MQGKYIGPQPPPHSAYGLFHQRSVVPYLTVGCRILNHHTKSPVGKLKFTGRYNAQVDAQRNCPGVHYVQRLPEHVFVGQKNIGSSFHCFA
jgi:hypothetical protein